MRTNKSLVTNHDFRMKLIFKDVMNLEPEVCYWAEPVTYDNVNWIPGICHNSSNIYFYLKNEVIQGSEEFAIGAEITVKLANNFGLKRNFSTKRISTHQFDPNGYLNNFPIDEISKFFYAGNLEIEYYVKIDKLDGVKKKLRSFDDDVAKEFSDVVLVVGDQKFHVLKMYLSLHSSYFNSLLFGNFDESKKMKIELKGIDPLNFQNFLEVIYGEAAINDNTVEGILELADMYQSKTAIRRCEEFLMEKSKKSQENKLMIAVKYNMDQLEKKCLTEMENISEINPRVPYKADRFSSSIWEAAFCLD